MAPKQKTKSHHKIKFRKISKCSTGIKGLDEISFGGIPRNTSTLVTGGTGCGKTLLGIQFLIQGALNNEPGLFIAFEESKDDIIQNFAYLGDNFKLSLDKDLIIVKEMHIDRAEFNESGEYNLEGLFVRLEYAIKKYKIKRVVIDTIEVLFSSLSHEGIIRSELERLIRWLKTKKVSSIVTAEEGRNSITRYGLEEYVADCVILLTNRIQKGLATRNLRIVKYRESEHGTNEYPYIIDQKGISVLPITSLTMDYVVSRKFISSGVQRLDEMLNGKGYYQGGSILITGTAGTGKSSLAAVFANGICKEGGKCLIFAFEESQDQIIRNMQSINIHLEKWVKLKRLMFKAIKPSAYGLESHLIKMIQLIDDFKPDAVVIDPITNLKQIGSLLDVKLMLSRLTAYLKSKQMTTLMTSLLREGTTRSDISVSSIMDTWLVLTNISSNGERSCLIEVRKSRGMPHSKQLRELIISNNGITLEDVYVGLGQILTGSERVIQVMKDQVKELEQGVEFNKKLVDNKSEQHNIESQIENLQGHLTLKKNEEKLLRANEKSIKDITDKAINMIKKIRLPKSTDHNKRAKNVNK